MFRRLMFIVCLVLIVACTPVTQQATGQAPEVQQPAENPPETEPPAVQPPPVSDAINWDYPYDPKPELCPEDGIADVQPLFLEITKENWNGTDVLVQRGLYTNTQNEIFRIDVMGMDENAIREYTANMRVCFDYLPVNVATEGYQEPESPSQEALSFGSNPQDLSIDIYLLGYFPPEMIYDEVYTNLKIAAESSVSEWRGKLLETKLIIPESNNDFVVHYIIDPSVASGGRHQYPERVATRVSVTVSVSGGSGSVIAGICRNWNLLNNTIMTVTKGGVETDSRSDDPRTGINYTYDLGVRGNAPSGGRYRISGVWWMPGWSAGYWDAVPPGSARNCNP